MVQFRVGRSAAGCGGLLSWARRAAAALTLVSLSALAPGAFAQAGNQACALNSGNLSTLQVTAGSGDNVILDTQTQRSTLDSLCGTTNGTNTEINIYPTDGAGGWVKDGTNVTFPDGSKISLEAVGANRRLHFTPGAGVTGNRVISPTTGASGTYEDTTTFTNRSIIVEKYDAFGGIPDYYSITVSVVGALSAPTAALTSLSPTTIYPGQSSQVTITLSNPNGSALSGLADTITLPSGVTIASTPGAANTCSGTLTASAGAGTASLSGGSVGANASCTIRFNVTATTPASYTIPSGAPSATGTPAGSAGSTASLTVNANPNPPTIAAAFGVSSISTSGSTTLTLTIGNPGSNSVSLSGLAVASSSLAGLTATLSSNNCGGTATLSGGNFSYSGGSALAAGATCTVVLTVSSSTPGSYSVTTGAVSASSPASVTGSTASTGALTINAVPAAPVTVTPANGASTNNARPTISGTAPANAQVKVSIDGALNGTVSADASGNWSHTPSGNLSEGSHTANAIATVSGVDSAASNTNTFTVDTIAPAAPAIGSPANGASTSDNTPTISGTAEPGAVVTVYVDSNPVGSATANGSGIWTVTSTTLADGSRSVRATAVDAAGNSSPSSSTVTITVDSTPPALPVIASPVGGGTTGSQPVISGTAEPGSTVTIRIDGGAVATVTADGSGNWSHSIGTPLSLGSHTVDARAADTLGNASSFTTPISFTVVAPLAIAPGAATGTTVGASYSQANPGSGGTTPLVYAVASGSLPAGTSLNTATGTVSGTPTAAGAFGYAISVTDANGAGTTVTGTTVSGTIAAGTQAISFTSTAPAGATVGGAAYAAAATASSGLTVTLSIDASASGVCTLSGGAVTFIAVGTCVVDANQAGNANWNAAPEVQQSFAVARGNQSISFAAIPNTAIGASPLTLAATASSNLAVSFSSGTTAVCTVSGNSLTLVAPGTCTVSADQPGDPNWNAAATVTHSFTVMPVQLAASQAQPHVAGTAGAALSAVTPVTGSGGFGTLSYALSGGTLPSGLAFSSANGSISGTPATALPTTTFTVTVSDSTTPTAQTASATFDLTIAKAATTVVLGSPGPIVAGGTVVYSATVTGVAPTGTVTFRDGGADIAGCVGVALSGTSASCTATPATGTRSIVAVYSGDANNLAGTSSAYSQVVYAALTAAQTTPVVTATVAASLTSVTPVTGVGGTGTLSYALSGGTLPAGLSFSTATGAISGTPTQAQAATSYTVTVTDQATPTAQSASNSFQLSVAKASQAITFAALPDVPLSTGSVTLAATASSNLAVTFTSSTSAVCTVSGATLTLVAGGTCTVTAEQGGDANWNAATPVAHSFTVHAPPVANAPPQVTVAFETATAIDLTAHVTGTATGIAIATAPTHGTATVSGMVVTYTPAAGYYGADSFAYTATGPGGTSAPATVSLAVGTPPAPVAADRSGVAVAYGSTGTAIDLTQSVTGVYASIAVAAAPAHGSATVQGHVVTYVPAQGYYGADSFTYTATGPGGTSAPATVTLAVATPPPPATQETSQTLPAATPTNAGSKVAIDLSGLTTGVYTSIQITRQPEHGTVQLQGNATSNGSGGGQQAQAAAAVVAIYQPNPGYVGPDSFAWVAIGPGGTSAPAQVSLQVIGNVPVLAPKTAQTGDGQTVSVELTQGASEGPFIAATIVSVTPANAAGATITASGSAADRHYRLDVTPAARFGGTVVVTYTLSNQFGTSQPSTVTVTVQARPDPTLDPNIRAISDAQAESARRFAQTQTGNFMRRNEQLHGGGGAGATMGFRLSSRDGNTGYRPRGSTSAEDALALSEPMRDAGLEDAAHHGLRRNRGMGGAGWARPIAGGKDGSRDGAVDGAVAPASAPQAGGEAESGPRRIGQLAIWTGGTVEVSTLDRTTRREKISASTGGLSAGVDVKLAPGLVIGVGGGYGEDTSKIGGDAARVQARNGVAAFYGSYTIAEGAFADFMLGYGSLDYRMRRIEANSGALTRGSRDGDMVLGALSAGVDRNHGAWRWSIYGRGEYMGANLDAYTETGAGRYDLRFAKRSVTSLSGVLGGRAEFLQKTIFGSVTPRLRIEWRHEFADSDPQWLDYADIPGAPLYRIDSQRWRRDRVELGLGSALDLGHHWAIDFELGIAAGQGERAGRLNIQVSKEF